MSNKKPTGIPTGTRLTGTFTRLSTSTTIPFDIIAYAVPSAFPTPNASFQITRQFQAGTNAAPFAVWLRAGSFVGFKGRDGLDLVEPAGNTNIDDRTQKEIFYFWDFDDADYVPRLTPNIPTAWRNTNLGYGKQVVHVFDAPGTYNVTCYAFDTQGNWGLQEHQVVVADKYTVFSAAQTISYSPANNFTGARAGGSNQTTIAGLRTALNNVSGVTLLELRNGETYTELNGLRRRNLPLFISTYGSSTTPPKVTDRAGIVQLRDSPECVIDGIDFEGTYRADTWRGRFGTLFFNDPGGDVGSYVRRLIIHRCTFKAFNCTPWPNNQLADQFFVASDSSFTDWGDGGYAFNFNSHMAFAFVGCDIFQNVDALSGDLESDGTQQAWGFQVGSTHGPIRSTTGPYNSYFSCTSIFSRTGWSTSGGNSQTTAPAADQACIRFWHSFPSGIEPQLRHHHYWERCTFEGGVSVVSLANGQRNPSERPRNHVMDKFVIAATSRTGFGALGGCQVGVELRNGYIWRKNQNIHIANQPFDDIGFIMRSDVNPQPIYDTTGLPPNRIYNCTLIINTPSGELDSTYTPIRMENLAGSAVANNVTIVPSRGTGTAFNPVGSTALAGFTLRDKGARWGFPPIGGPALPAGLLRVTDFRKGGPGPVANGEWIEVDYPNYTGYCRGNNASGPLGQVTQAIVLANSTQYHRFTVRSEREKGIAPSAVGGSGRVAFNFTSTKIEVQNLTGVTWTETTPSGNPANPNIDNHFQIHLDLTDHLMDFVSDTGQFGESIPAPRPLAGSSALGTGTTQPRAADDFFGTRRPGILTNAGAVVPGNASQGAFEP